MHGVQQMTVHRREDSLTAFLQENIATTKPYSGKTRNFFASAGRFYVVEHLRALLSSIRSKHSDKICALEIPHGGSPMARTLLFSAGGVILFVAIAIARRFRHVDPADHLPPSVLTRIRSDYPD
jgi:hypothetical protein